MFQFPDAAVSVADIAAVKKTEMIPGVRTVYGIVVTLKTVPRKDVPIWWDRSSGGVSEKSQRDAAYDALLVEWNAV